VHLPAKVGPKLLGHIARHIQQGVGAPDAEGGAECALALRMIRVRDARCDAVPHDFGVIELTLAAIRASDEDAACGVHGAVPDAPSAELEIPRVLTQQRREYRRRHQGADSRVRVQRGIAPRVALYTLTVGRVAVTRLPDERQRPKDTVTGSDMVVMESLNFVFAESGRNCSWLSTVV